MKRVFITGGTGFFGKSILDYLKRNPFFMSDVEWTILTRDSSKFLSRNSELIDSNRRYVFLNGDVRTFNFPKKRFDAILHLASPLLGEMPDEKIAGVIMAGTRHIADLALRDNAILLFSSSGAVYGPSEGLVSESAKCNPVLGYGRAKLLSEQYFISHGVKVKVARCFAFVGKYLPRNGGFAIGNFVQNCVSGMPIEINGDGTPLRSYLYADDLVEWLFAILYRGEVARAYNVGSDEAISIRQLADKVRSILKKENKIIISGQRILGTSSCYVPNVNRARTELGLNVRVCLADAIRQSA